MGDIIIRNETLNQSWRFTPNDVGYAEAYTRIQAITGLGHRVGGDVARVTEYMRRK